MIECLGKFLILLYCIVHASCKDRSSYSRYLDVQGYKCSDRQICEVPGRSDVGECASECSTRESCMLFSYNRVAGLCQIHSQILSLGSSNCTQDENTDHYINDYVSPSNTLPMVARESVGVEERSYFGNSALMRIMKEGEIIQWQFYSVAVGGAMLQVWRPRNDLENGRYEFVGQNFLKSKIIGEPDNLNVPEHERIQVQSGDVIGIYYDDPAAGITYSDCNATETPDAAGMSLLEREVDEASFFVPGSIYTQTTQDNCQIFSLKAMVGPKRTQILSQVNSSPIKSRSSVGSSKKVYMGLNDNFKIRVDGRLSIWKFYSKITGTLALQVWRLIRGEQTQQISFVGQNILTSVSNAPQDVYVDEADRIQVKAGDYIAVYYGVSKGGLCYDDCDEEINPESNHVGYSLDQVDSPDEFYEGKVMDLIFPLYNCRVFSLTAFIQPTAS
ncbi:uncharacterized protein [Haliotis cracherodii]|uniref:uncharacterized protein n=1 Tax=Haliotis cracherodii TaxID=6455 RepID=UPI0039E828F9